MSNEKSSISSGILSSTKEEGNSVVNGMDEPKRNDGKWNKLDTNKQMTCLHYIWGLQC